MGGPRGAPPGKFHPERLVHVDSPEIRKRYEARERALFLEHAETVSKLENQVAALQLNEKSLQKRFDDVLQDRERLRSERPSTLAPAGPPLPSGVASDRLSFQVTRLKDELAAVTKALMEAKSGAAAPVEIVREVEVVREVPKLVFRDVHLLHRKNGMLAVIATVVAGLGAVGGHVATKSRPAPIAAVAPAASPSPSPTPSMTGVKNAKRR